MLDTLSGKRDFLGPYLRSRSLFSLCTFLSYLSIFSKYFVRRSVGQATKGKRASLLFDVIILVYTFRCGVKDKVGREVHVRKKRYALQGV